MNALTRVLFSMGLLAAAGVALGVPSGYDFVMKEDAGGTPLCVVGSLEAVDCLTVTPDGYLLVRDSGYPPGTNSGVKFLDLNGSIQPYNDLATESVIESIQGYQTTEYYHGSIAGGNNPLQSFSPQSTRANPDGYFFVAGDIIAEWQPRDANPPSATYDTYRVYPDGSEAVDGMGCQHSGTVLGAEGTTNIYHIALWDTLAPGTTDERNLILATATEDPTRAYHDALYRIELGEYEAPVSPATETGTREILVNKSAASRLLTKEEMDGLFGTVGVDHTGIGVHESGGKQYVYFVANGGAPDPANDTKWKTSGHVYVAVIEILDWDAGTWQQVDLSSDPVMYLHLPPFFESPEIIPGSRYYSFAAATDILFVDDPGVPGNELMLLATGRSRVFTFDDPLPIPPPPPPPDDVIPEPGSGLALLALAGLTAALRRRG